MKPLIEIVMDNAAFADDLHAELTWILRQLASKIAVGPGKHRPNDSNRNAAGSFRAVEGGVA